MNGYINAGVFTETISFPVSFTQSLGEYIAKKAPKRIALDFSENNPASDGLSMGMYKLLQEAFEVAGFQGEVVSAEASAQMLDILKDQRLNGKLPFFLHTMGVPVAHKTGEDDGITHDVGIIYAKEPMVCCFVGEHVDVPGYERLMQDAAKWVAEEGL